MEATDKKLLDRIVHAIHLKHYSYRTEQACVSWVGPALHFPLWQAPSYQAASWFLHWNSNPCLSLASVEEMQQPQHGQAVQWMAKGAEP